MAPKQAGCEVIKRRRMRLERGISDTAMRQIAERLLTMMGVHAVEADDHQITITYDLLQVTAEQIEAVLREEGTGLAAGLGERLAHALIHYIEETELANLEVRPSPHVHGGHHHG